MTTTETSTLVAATSATEVPLLPSFVEGEWWSPGVDARASAAPVRDASTGELVSLVSSAGLDVEAAVRYARTVGQKSLGALTFHQRALILKALGAYLTEHKAELYAVSTQTGATKRDSGVDIDGGIGVLFTYGSKGRRELPNSTVIVDGAPENLARDGSFGGQHVYTRVPGVAFQVNAFNFPVWGMLEKFAPAFLAGVPSIAKPATPTAYLTEACVRLMDASGLLPSGSLQLISGSVRGFLDHLDLRDRVGFTGSASTARSLFEHANVISGGVGLTAETDSLNAAILGPDAAPGTPEFDAFVASVVTEITSKAGQKCTCIRRVIVPRAQMDAVIDAVGARITARTVVGDPRADGVTMGPLASIEQRDEVLRSIDALLAGGGRIAFAADDAAAEGEQRAAFTGPQVVRADGSVGESPDGAFLAPVVLRFDDSDSAAVHEIEAFGPVCSVIGYDDVDDAVRLANLGGGSLVATIASVDPAAVATLFGGIAPFHGRVLVLDRDDARTSTGHGSPVPHLVHGGPGRAGGGEELGGIRAVKHFMQRTAVQGTPAVLTALTGEWREGAPTSQSGAGAAPASADEESVDSVDESGAAGVSAAEHPFRKPLSRLRLGDAVASDAREITLDDISHFAEFTGDTFYAHTNEEAAAANPFFPGRVAHGYLLLSWAAGLFVDPEPGPVLANYGLENLRFVTPVSPGDRVHVTLTAKQITPRENESYGEVRWDAVLRNQHDEPVATYDVLTLVSKE
ncbi:phenylacetic acid degradation bifunctional protein PaaZ [Subtercola lobariae]|uniref:Bifunctional aldehyde dehydrogenase/enoyl-CoA hydratase n=1 Tax=Subtercola lobariae TaxID=1588641 RepID=A0A917EVD3_9MICO|nr:phenylacetic acid degradation bifunctional protein PaaZ [Subtercola lobariae]GGF11729.1 bifunctional aldehyde dehydrogenase/enoyl-CoA hydratase [Subtercola lobariae]